MWHASAAPLPGVRLSRRHLERLARAALDGVGRGREWVEYGPGAAHVRRRLSPAEEAQVGPALDLRGTAEGWDRYAAMEAGLPPPLRRLAMGELLERRACS